MRRGRLRDPVFGQRVEPLIHDVGAARSLLRVTNGRPSFLGPKPNTNISDNHSPKHTADTAVVSTSLLRSDVVCHCHDTRGRLLIAPAIVSERSEIGIAQAVGTTTISSPSLFLLP